MNRKFEKKLSLKDMIIYWFRNLKWVVLFSVILSLLMAGALYVKSSGSERGVASDGYQLIDGNYVCTTLVSITPVENINSDKDMPVTTYLSAMISNTVITDMINELGIKDNFIDIFHKLTWWQIGYTVKLSLTSPVKEIDGYSLDVILNNLVAQGEEYIIQNYNISEFKVIDQAYYENPLFDKQVVTSDHKPWLQSQLSNLIIIVTISGILTSGFFLIKYLLNTKITNPEEIMEYLDLPVLTVITERGTENIKRVTNIILNNRSKTKSICIAGISNTSKEMQIAELFLEDIKNRSGKVSMIDLRNSKADDEIEQKMKDLSENHDFVILSAPDLMDSPLSVYAAGKCDATILLIEEETVDGSKAIQLKKELDLNGAQSLGVIYIK